MLPAAAAAVVPKVVAILLAALLGLAASAAQAQAQPPLRVATWNLGWHLDAAQTRSWAEACGQPFALDPKDQLWKPSAQGDRSGWSLSWGRNAPIAWSIDRMPPCDVYRDGPQNLAVTEAADATRRRQIRTILAERVKADVIAFQEVSGAASVREVLPEGGAGYEVCSYEGHKVQRLAIAWKSALGKLRSCEVYWPLSLPQMPPKDQPRPGLALTLEVGGKLLRILTLHLKSSCVSPLEEGPPAGRGQLDGDEPNCLVLQAQVPALEAWIEQATTADAPAAVVVLGDFNRSLAHEAAEPATMPVRAQGRADAPHQPGVRSRNLWREVNDGAPQASQLTLLEAHCPDGEGAEALCTAARQRRLSREEYQRLGAPPALGCRNPVGLDYIVLGARARATGPAVKVPLGLMGRSNGPTANRPDPLLAVSDHCPLVAEIRLPP